jgi:hypothetical protein
VAALDPKRRRIWLAFALFTMGFPILLAFWDLSAGVLALLVCLSIFIRANRILRSDARNELARDHNYQRLQQLQGERGRTIWVSPLDGSGQPLDAAGAEAKLAQARAEAGPRDMVVGVRTRVG